jgi:hypothetical protein
MGFHLGLGIVVALVYAYVLEPRAPRRRRPERGALYAIAVWLLNAFVVLPATGEGFAGSAHLTLAGITWFAAAHTCSSWSWRWPTAPCGAISLAGPKTIVL